MLAAEPETISSSHRRPRAIALTRRARRSIRIGRTSFRWTPRGMRICWDFLDGGFCQAIVRVYAAGIWLAVLGDKVLIHRFDNDVFDVGCGNAGDRSNRYGLGLTLEMRQRDVIAVADSSFGGVGWDHAVACIIVQQARQEMVRFGFGVISVGPLIGEPLLNC